MDGLAMSPLRNAVAGQGFLPARRRISGFAVWYNVPDGLGRIEESGKPPTQAHSAMFPKEAGAAAP